MLLIRDSRQDALSLLGRLEELVAQTLVRQVRGARQLLVTVFDHEVLHLLVVQVFEKQVFVFVLHLLAAHHVQLLRLVSVEVCFFSLRHFLGHCERPLLARVLRVEVSPLFLELLALLLLCLLQLFEVVFLHLVFERAVVHFGLSVHSIVSFKCLHALGLVVVGNYELFK